MAVLGRQAAAPGEHWMVVKSSYQARQAAMGEVATCAAREPGQLMVVFATEGKVIK